MREQYFRAGLHVYSALMKRARGNLYNRGSRCKKWDIKDQEPSLLLKTEMAMMHSLPGPAAMTPALYMLTQRRTQAIV